MKFNILFTFINHIWLHYYNNKIYLARTLLFLRSFRHISAVKPPYLEASLNHEIKTVTVGNKQHVE